MAFILDAFLHPTSDPQSINTHHSFDSLIVPDDEHVIQFCQWTLSNSVFALVSIRSVIHRLTHNTAWAKVSLVVPDDEHDFFSFGMLSNSFTLVLHPISDTQSINAHHRDSFG
jgi:hypothetical protein